MTQPERAPYDVVVIGGGPAGIAASIWAARYRRRVAMIDAGQQRNRWSQAAHGYLGLEGADPAAILAAGREGLERYREIDIVDGRQVTTATSTNDGVFLLVLDDGDAVRAHRLILATGVRDVFPPVPEFEDYFGRSIFTCPSCDGYEAQHKTVAVVGDSPEIAEFAVGLLDWARSVVVVHESSDWSFDEQATAGIPVDDVEGRVVGIAGHDHQVESLVLDGGDTVPCDVVFWSMQHEQQSDLPAQLGCEMTGEGCVAVDEEGATSIEWVYAAGDMTPGPHLVQIAAAEGARAGIAAAASLRGHTGSPMSPRPAPDADTDELTTA